MVPNPCNKQVMHITQERILLSLLNQFVNVSLIPHCILYLAFTSFTGKLTFPQEMHNLYFWLPPFSFLDSKKEDLFGSGI